MIQYTDPPASPRSSGSIAEVWAWLIHLPYLGWALFGIGLAIIAAFISYAVFEIRAGMDRSRPGY